MTMARRFVHNRQPADHFPGSRFVLALPGLPRWFLPRALESFLARSCSARTCHGHGSRLLEEEVRPADWPPDDRPLLPDRPPPDRPLPCPLTGSSQAGRLTRSSSHIQRQGCPWGSAPTPHGGVIYVAYPASSVSSDISIRYVGSIL